MIIVYVADHGCGLNDDEGAISQALKDLGHIVKEIHTSQVKSSHLRNMRGDLLLFHHSWQNERLLQMVRRPKVMWGFDLINFPSDPLFIKCQKARTRWLNKLTELVDLIFISDGDWVNQDRTGKLIRLTQGADTRNTKQISYPDKCSYSVLFAGSRGGTTRRSCIDFLMGHYRTDFTLLEKGSQVYGKKLAGVIRRTKIMIAPDGPVTDHYWSNRVYVLLGYGAFLIHPYCETLTQQYEDGKEIVLYQNREELKDKIDYYLCHDAERRAIQQAGYIRTIAEHTYMHRCEKLIKTCRERLGLPQ